MGERKLETRVRRKSTAVSGTLAKAAPAERPVAGPPYPPDHPLWEQAMAAAEAIWAETDPKVSVAADDAWLRELRESCDERLTRIYEDPDR